MGGISTGPNSRPLNDTLAETGPGIADDAVGPDQLAPDDLGRDAEQQAQALLQSGWAAGLGAQPVDNELAEQAEQAEGEAEASAHPS